MDLFNSHLAGFIRTLGYVSLAINLLHLFFISRQYAPGQSVIVGALWIHFMFVSVWAAFSYNDWPVNSTYVNTFISFTTTLFLVGTVKYFYTFYKR